MASVKRIAVVTGANKGIGLEICKQLASSGVMVVLTARDVQRGTAAVKSLHDRGLLDVVFHQLDVMDKASIVTLADFIKIQFGKLDILVNNAAVVGSTILSREGFTYSEDVIIGSKAKLFKPVIIQTYGNAEQCLRTNYYGVKQLSTQLLPLLQQSSSPRIVNVSSSAGQLKYVTNEKAKKELSDVNNLTEEKVNGIVKGFLEDIKAGVEEENGWPTNFSAYLMSKAVLNAYTRILAKNYPDIAVNCVHPGYIKTDLNDNTGVLSVEEGASGPVMLALMPENGPSGMYYNGTEVSAF